VDARAARPDHPDVRCADLAAFIWLRETGAALAALPRGTPLMGTHEGTAFYLLFNGALGDQRPARATCSPPAVLAALHRSCCMPAPRWFTAKPAAWARRGWRQKASPLSSCRTRRRAKLHACLARSLTMTTVDTLVAQAQQLSPDELELLVLRLQDRLDEFASPEIEAAWTDEIERRMQAMDRGEVELIPWEQARKQLAMP